MKDTSHKYTHEINILLKIGIIRAFKPYQINSESEEQSRLQAIKLIS